MKQFSIGLTGLSSHQHALETSASNIANASTVGYKAGEFLFADQFSTYLSQTDAGKVGQGAMEIGVRRNFSQGSFRKTGSQFDVAISGEGFLVTSPASDGSGQKFLTRNGQLAVDKNRFLINSNGQFVYGRATYASTGETSSNDLVPMSLPAETIEPQKTIDAKLQFNLNRAIQAPVTRAAQDAYRTTRFDFNPKDPSSFDYQTSVTVYDSVGAKHELRNFYRRESGLEVNQWAMYTYMDDYALKLDSSGQWSAAKPEIDTSTGEPRRDSRGAIVQSIYEPGRDSNTFVGNRLSPGIDASALERFTSVLPNGLKISNVAALDGSDVGTATLQVRKSGSGASEVIKLALSYNGLVYESDTALADFPVDGAPQPFVFKNGDKELVSFSVTPTGKSDVTAALAASALTSSPQTSSLSFAGLTLTSVNFGETAVEGSRYQIAKGDKDDTLELQILPADGGEATTVATAFVGIDLAAGGKTSIAFRSSNDDQTIMTINLQNPSGQKILSTNKADTTLPKGLQELLTTGRGSAKDEALIFEAKSASVRRPQAVRYIFEVDPTTGTMLDTLNNPVGKIFDSLPNGEPDKASGVDGLIPKLSPAFKYTLKMGADYKTLVDGVPFGGTNALLNFEISQWEGTSVNSANSQTKSVQVGGRSLSRLTGLTIDPGGRMVASYSNGDITYGSRLALALVPAENGLIPVGSNLFQESYFSGQSTIGNPGDPGFGTIRSETVEDSNLDLAQELVKLTQLQRIYQANAKTISSADELLKTLLQI
jgi:flagellar hook-basal body protein